MLDVVKDSPEVRGRSGRRRAAACGISAVLNGCALVALALVRFSMPGEFEPVTLLVALATQPPAQVEPVVLAPPPPAAPIIQQESPPAPQEGTIDPIEPPAAEPEPAEVVQAAAAEPPAPALPLPEPVENDERQPWPDDATAIFSDASLALSEADGEEEEDNWSDFNGSGTGNPGGGKVNYFGIETKGDAVVFVVDASGSMRGERFKEACAELLYTVDNLAAFQSFAVFFFNDHRHSEVFPAEEKLAVADAASKEALRQWVATVRPQGDTHPTLIVRRALRLKPNLMFFLSDGDIPKNTVRVAKADNQGAAVIHTICFQSEDGEELLRKMARENGGEYHYVE